MDVVEPSNYPIRRWARNSGCRAVLVVPSPAGRCAPSHPTSGPWRDAVPRGGVLFADRARCASAHVAQVTLRPLGPLWLSILLALASRQGAAQARSRPIGVVKLGESTATVEATNVGYALVTVSDGDQEQSIVVRADALAAWVDSARAIVALVPKVQPKGQAISPALSCPATAAEARCNSGPRSAGTPGLAINVATPGASDLVVPLSAGSFGELASVLDLAVRTTRQLSPRTFARAAPAAPPPAALPPTVAATTTPRGEKVAISTGALTAATPPRDAAMAHDPVPLGTPASESVSHVERGAIATSDAEASAAAGVVTERRDADVLGGYARAHGRSCSSATRNTGSR